MFPWPEAQKLCIAYFIVTNFARIRVKLQPYAYALLAAPGREQTVKTDQLSRADVSVSHPSLNCQFHPCTLASRVAARD